MEDIELVIKISEEDLQSIRKKVFTVEEMFKTTQGRVYRAIVNGTPQPKTEVLDKIRAEVKALPNANPSYSGYIDVVDREDVLEIIDKYRAESEEV